MLVAVEHLGATRAALVGSSIGAAAVTWAAAEGPGPGAGLVLLGPFVRQVPIGRAARRTLRAALHGFVTLEAAGGFALAADVGTSFDRMVVALASTLERWVVSPSVDPSGPAPSRDPAGTGYPGRGSTPPLDPRR